MVDGVILQYYWSMNKNGKGFQENDKQKAYFNLQWYQYSIYVTVIAQKHLSFLIYAHTLLLVVFVYM